MSVTLYVPVKTESLNVGFRLHRMAMVRKTKAQRLATHLAWRMVGSPRVDPPAVVTLTRVASRALDTDNLAGSMKAIRDQVAMDVLRCDDRDKRVRWDYAEEKPAKPKTFGVRITVVEGSV